MDAFGGHMLHQFQQEQHNLKMLQKSRCRYVLKQFSASHIVMNLAMAFFITGQMLQLFVFVDIGFGIVIAYEIFVGYHKIMIFKYSFSIKRQRKLNRYILQFFDSFLNLSSEVLILIFWNLGVYLYFSGVCLVLQLLLRIIYHIQHRKNSKFIFIVSLYKIITSVIFGAAFFSITLKIDSLISLDWDQSFWWFWIVVGLFLAMTLVALLILANHYLSILFGDQAIYEASESTQLLIYQQVKQIVWVINFTSFLTTLCYCWVNGSKQLIRGQEPTFLWGSLGIIGVHVILYLYFTTQWKDPLVDFFIKLMFDDAQKNKEAQKKKIEKAKQPRFLQRLSAGYFRIIDNVKAYFKRKKDQSSSSSTMRQRRAESQCPRLPTLNLRDNPISIITYLESERNDALRLKKVSMNVSTRRTNAKNDLDLEDGSDDKNCIICFETESKSVLMPCGHGGFCYKCAMIQLNDKKLCFVCRQSIDVVLNIEQNQVHDEIFDVIQVFNR